LIDGDGLFEDGLDGLAYERAFVVCGDENGEATFDGFALADCRIDDGCGLRQRAVTRGTHDVCHSLGPIADC
jgi:hypothetical protein